MSAPEAVLVAALLVLAVAGLVAGMIVVLSRRGMWGWNRGNGNLDARLRGREAERRRRRRIRTDHRS